MGTFEPSVSLKNTAAPFFALARRSGLALPSVENDRVASRDFYEVVAHLRHALVDVSPGLAVAHRIGPSCDAEIRAMVTCAPTVGHAFASLGASSALYFDDVSLEVSQEGRHLALRPVIRPARHDGAHELAAALFAGAIGYLTQTLGRTPPHHAVLRPSGRSRAHLRSVFARVSEAPEESVLLIPRAVGGIRPRRANDALFAYFYREACARSERRIWAGSVTERVRTLLTASRAPLRTNVVGAADALGVCVRTLQRRLGEEGTTFERIQGTVLRQRALDGLSCMNAREVARALGYADQSAFHRAVRGWSGKTPGQLGEALCA